MKVFFTDDGMELKKKGVLSSARLRKLSGVWHLNRRQSQSWIFQKQERLLALYQTSAHIWRNQGATAFANRLYRFLKGERRNTAVIFRQRSSERTKTEAELYEQWIRKNSLDENAVKAQAAHQQTLDYRPLISVITPVYNTDEQMLTKMIESVLAQTYSNWELCLVDGASPKSTVRSILDQYSRQDERIKVKYLNENLGISGNSNEAIQMARGEFIALLDHDDELTVDALYENVLLLNRKPNADMIYSDEDKLDFDGRRCDAHFKPDWSPDLFCSMMYTCHLGLYRKSLVEQIGGFRKGFDGAQDYDLVLRLIEKTSEIYHIPKVLYHWRKTKGSTALSLDNKDYAVAAQIKAVAEHFKRLNIRAEVTPGLAANLLRVKRLPGATPKVSIIIPTRDQAQILKNCLDSIRQKTAYQNYEIIVVDNESAEPETLSYLQKISKEDQITVLNYDHPFNFAAINNYAAKHATGEILLFLNNDTEIISEEWLDAMVEHAVRPEVGAVGARMLYPDGTVQHAGVITGIGGVAGHAHKHFHRNDPGYFGRTKAIQNVSAVTGACLMVRMEIFELLGGFNEKDLAIAFNDIDFCLRVRQLKLLIVYTPYAEIYHYESVSRGFEQTSAKFARFQKESKYMKDFWKEILRNDPYYNPNLTTKKENFSIFLE